MPKTFYRNSDALEGLSEGAWLVIVKRNDKSARKLIKPSFAEVDAALDIFSEAVLQAMHKACEMRPTQTPLSEKEQKAWKAYRDIMGDDIPRYFEYPGLREIVDAGCKAIKEKVVAKIKYDDYYIT